jgi:hypothetical protein
MDGGGPAEKADGADMLLRSTMNYLKFVKRISYGKEFGQCEDLRFQIMRNVYFSTTRRKLMEWVLQFGW